MWMARSKERADMTGLMVLIMRESGMKIELTVQELISGQTVGGILGSGWIII